MNCLTTGMLFSDPEGEFEIIAIDGEDVTVVNIQDGNLNEGHEYVIPYLEAVISYFGWDQIVELMDVELCEELHGELSPCDGVEFLQAYMARHFEKFGEEFTIG